MPRLVDAICIGVLLATASASHANVVSWELVNLSFDDGATAHGRFTLDTVLNQITDFDIFTSAGATGIDTAFQYTPATARITQQSNVAGGSGWPDVFMQLNSLDGIIPGATRELFLAFSQQLVLGGTATVLHDGTLGRTSYEHLSGGEVNQHQRFVVGPGVVDPPIVPEPAQMTWLAIGLAVLVGVAWRQRRPTLSVPGRLRAIS